MNKSKKSYIHYGISLKEIIYVLLESKKDKRGRRSREFILKK